MPVKIAKEFKLSNIGDDELIYRGAVILDEHSLYLVHNTHRWGSADQNFAIFGLFGFVLHYLDSIAVEVPYPYEPTPYAELKDRLEQAHGIGKVKKTAVVMRVPRQEIRGYTNRLAEYTQILCNRGPITLYGEVSNLEAILGEYGLSSIQV
jgi:hypothetical protein